jgi:hypothetical protein
LRSERCYWTVHSIGLRQTGVCTKPSLSVGYALYVACRSAAHRLCRRIIAKSNNLRCGCGSTIRIADPSHFSATIGAYTLIGQSAILKGDLPWILHFDHPAVFYTVSLHSNATIQTLSNRVTLLHMSKDQRYHATCRQACHIPARHHTVPATG